jgi:GH24 family phage-related lysozyme (muramidase)
MKTSQRGIELIKEYEGLRLKSYLCPANVWTIGYGRGGWNALSRGHNPPPRD